jgi:hypothetical protein
MSTREDDKGGARHKRATPDEIVARDAEVLRLSAEGKGTVEISRLMNIGDTLVTRSKVRLGLLSESAKLWSDIRHAAVTLQAMSQSCETLAAEAQRVQFGISNPEFSDVMRQLNRSKKAIASLSKALKGTK